MKTKYLFLFLFICVLYTVQITAQRFKAELFTGLSTSQIDGDTQKGFDKLGFYAGVSVATEFTKVLGAKTELYYIGKGAKQSSNGYEIYKTKLHYVEMPFMLTIKPIDKFEFDLGLAAAYLISGTLYENQAEVPDGLVDMNNFDFCAIISALYFFNKRLGINIRMDYSFTPVKNNPNWFNSNLSFGMVYKIN
jgi:hypothetical protein